MQANREFFLRLGEGMMTMALDHLVRDGYVAFACLLLSKEGEMVPILLETVNAQSKARLRDMLRMLAPHCGAIVIISEAWTLNDAQAIRSLNGPVAQSSKRKEGVFVQVGSPLGDLLLTATFERDAHSRPIRPTEVNAAWQPENTANTNFQNLFSASAPPVAVATNDIHALYSDVS